MNKQDEDKAKEIAKEYGINFPESHSSAYPLCYKATLDMAAWKEQQMIEKAILFLRQHNCTIAATIGTEKAKQFIIEIEDFKKYMKEN